MGGSAGTTYIFKLLPLLVSRAWASPPSTCQSWIKQLSKPLNQLSSGVKLHQLTLPGYTNWNKESAYYLSQGQSLSMALITGR